MLGIDEIEKILPHRHPFLLIDRVEELEPGRRAVAYKAVSFEAPYFQGHFPGNPVMPGVLMIEALAQTGAVAILSQETMRGKTAYFGGIQQARFKRMVRPGELLRLECELIKLKGPIGVGSARATVNGELAVSAELSFVCG